MRKLLPFIIACCVIVSGLEVSALSSQRATKRKPRPATPQAIGLVDLAGVKALISRDKQTKPLLVNFWATWCDPCRDEFPDLVKIDQDYRSKGLDFVAISLDDAADIKTAVPEFLRQVKATMPVYLLNVSDPEPVIMAVDKDWSGALPATFLYDAQGKVVFRHYGRVKTPELRDAIEKVMSGK